MAITSEQGTKILKVVVGLFNGGISAGNLTGLVTLIDQGASVADLSDRLATGSLFTDKILGGNFTVSNQVNVMMNNFGLVADSDPTSAGSQAEQFFTNTISGGVGLGAIVNAAVDFLSQDNVPAAFSATAALLDNKAVVAEIYAGRNPPDDFATMIALLADVTATSPATRDDAIAFVDIFDANKISLTSGVDNITGTSEIDIFTGDQNTAASEDTLIGGDGQDILRLFNTQTTPNISGIEKVVYISPGQVDFNFFDVSSFADVTSFELKNTTAFNFGTIQTSPGQAVTLTNIVGKGVVNKTNIRMRGEDSSLDLTLDQVDFLNQGKLTFINADFDKTVTDLRALNITLVNNPSSLEIDLLNTGLETLNIVGDQDFTARLTFPAMIDASSASGNIEIVGSFERDITFKGGSGDDRIEMGKHLNPGDILMGGAGIDTLSVSHFVRSTFSSAPDFTNISEFEILEFTGEGSFYNLSGLDATSPLTGLIIDAFSVTISNINSASANNIQIKSSTTHSHLGHRLQASDFTAGGRNDAATITLDNDLSSSGVTTFVNFPDVDFLHLVSKNGDSPRHFFNHDPINSFSLTLGSRQSSDLDEIKITGNESLHLLITERPDNIDASGLDAPLDFVFGSSEIPSADSFSGLEFTGTSYDDKFDFRENAINTSFLFTGGGSDEVFYNGENSSDKRFMLFSATELNTGDLKAGDATTVLLDNAVAGATVTIGLGFLDSLKSGGTFLSATNTNIDIHGTSLSDTTNIAAIQAIHPAGFGLDLQIDLNGDGFFNAKDDAVISLLGSASNDFNDTLVYDAFDNVLIYTVV